MIHLEGMGIIGCYLGLRLAADGFEFTWNDTDERVAAWRASTGAVFPTGHADDLEALAVWRGHLDDDWFSPYLEEAAYVFSQKHPPHGGRYQHFELPGTGVRVANECSVHLNAQAWVPAVRRLFQSQRIYVNGHKPKGARRVITHGFGPRLARFMWGWTVPVKLGFNPELYSADPRRARYTGKPQLRPCIYCREGRFVMAYAYPVPRTEYWYAGSSLISQHVPKELAIEAKYRRWRDQFLRMTEGFVTGVSRAGVPVQAWRPVPAAEDGEWVTEQRDGALAVRPLWHSGIRHAPLVYNALMEVL